MGTFTMPLKTVLEIENGDIGLQDYPIFEKSYRESLNQKIIDHYWNQEIGQESISMFKLALNRKMREIMPLYNQHYVLSLLEIDPLSTVSIKSLTETEGNANTEGTNTAENSSSSTSGSNAKSRNVASDTPQTQLNPTQDYATSMQDSVSESAANGTATENQSQSSNESQTQTGTSENTMSGYQGHAPMLILQARQALVNVDMMVIAELQELFMLIWSNADSFSQNTYPYIGGFRYGLY